MSITMTRTFSELIFDHTSVRTRYVYRIKEGLL